MTHSSDNNNDGFEAAETGPTVARVRRTPWRGWLMAVPLAALILVGFLVIRTWVFQGPTVTVTFPRSAGISAQGTAVKYQGLKVGQVTDVVLIDDLQRVRATLQMKSSVEDALNKQTVFWIVSPSILSGSITTLISGAYIAMQRGSGPPRERFKGRLKPPRTPANVAGRIVTLYATKKGSLGRGSIVLYHGIRAGRILTTDYQAAADQIKFRALVKKPFANKLGANDRFWRAGGFGLHPGGGGIEIDVPRPKVLLAGAIAFGDIQPSKQNTTTGEDGRPESFLLYDGKRAARLGLAGPSREFSLASSGIDLPDIAVDAPVTLDAKQIGHVSKARMRYDPDAERIRTDLAITIYAQALGIPRQAGSTTENNATSRLVNAIDKLIANGLRAKIATGTPVIGSTHIALAMTAKEGAKSLDRTQSPPAIPMIGDGGGGLVAQIHGIVGKIDGIVEEVETIPLAEIGENVRKATGNLRELTASQKIETALSRLNSILAHLDDVTATADGKVKPILASLREAAAQARNVLEQIENLTGGSASNQANLQQLAKELTRAARSIRVLTDYLRRNPAALIYGRE